MQREESRGLVLKSLDYKQRQRIITVLTEDRGLITLIVKGLNRTQGSLLLLTNPLSHGEFHYSVHRSDLYTLRDATLIHPHLELRSQVAFLQTAGEICQGLLSSQLPGKPAPKLYQLTLSYLKQIPHHENLPSLSASFLLKILKHEGFVSQQRSCTECGGFASHLAFGEAFCTLHAPRNSIFLNDDEWQLLFTWMEARDFTTLKEARSSDLLYQKVKRAFTERYSPDPWSST